jgi:hypothetical protein
MRFARLAPESGDAEGTLDCPVAATPMQPFPADGPLRARLSHALGAERAASHRAACLVQGRNHRRGPVSGDVTGVGCHVLLANDGPLRLGANGDVAVEHQGACHATLPRGVMIRVMVGGDGVPRTDGRSKRRPYDDG